MPKISKQLKEWREQISLFLANCYRDIQKKPFRAIIIFLLMLVCGWFFGIGSAILWSFFLMFFVYSWESRVLGAIAILLLVACPILLSVELDTFAEGVAVYAFFFLTMTLVLQIISYKRSV